MENIKKNNFYGIVWENKGKRGYLEALFVTFKNVLFHPSNSFSQMEKTSGFIKSFSFSVIMVIFGNTVSTFGTFYFSPDVAGRMLGNIYFNYFLLPIITMIGIFIGSELIHLFLVLSKVQNSSFKNAFRVLAYCESIQILSIFPFYLSTSIVFTWVFVFVVWIFILQTIGIREVFQISTKKAFLIILCSFIVVRIILSPISLPGLTDILGL